MVRIAGVIAILMATAITLSACVVEAPGPRGPGCIPPHTGPYGGYHPGTCR